MISHMKGVNRDQLSTQSHEFCVNLTKKKRKGTKHNGGDFNRATGMYSWQISFFKLHQLRIHRNHHKVEIRSEQQEYSSRNFLEKLQKKRRQGNSAAAVVIKRFLVIFCFNYPSTYSIIFNFTPYYSNYPLFILFKSTESSCQTKLKLKTC